MTEKARFHIEVPLEDLELARVTLKQIGIDFNPLDDMLHLPQDNLLYSVFTGTNGQYAVDKINEHLQQDDSTQARVNQDFNNMSPETRRDLLELATLHIEWTSDYNPQIGGLDSNALQDFLDTNFVDPKTPA